MISQRGKQSTKIELNLLSPNSFLSRNQKNTSSKGLQIKCNIGNLHKFECKTQRNKELSLNTDKQTTPRLRLERSLLTNTNNNNNNSLFLSPSRNIQVSNIFCGNDNICNKENAEKQNIFNSANSTFYNAKNKDQATISGTTITNCCSMNTSQTYINVNNTNNTNQKNALQKEYLTIQHQAPLPSGNLLTNSNGQSYSSLYQKIIQSKTNLNNNNNELGEDCKSINKHKGGGFDELKNQQQKEDIVLRDQKNQVKEYQSGILSTSVSQLQQQKKLPLKKESAYSSNSQTLKEYASLNNSTSYGKSNIIQQISCDNLFNKENMSNFVKPLATTYNGNNAQRLNKKISNNNVELQSPLQLKLKDNDQKLKYQQPSNSNKQNQFSLIQSNNNNINITNNSSNLQFGQNSQISEQNFSNINSSQINLSCKFNSDQQHDHQINNYNISMQKITNQIWQSKQFTNAINSNTNNNNSTLLSFSQQQQQKQQKSNTIANQYKTDTNFFSQQSQNNKCNLNDNTSCQSIIVDSIDKGKYGLTISTTVCNNNLISKNKTTNNNIITVERKPTRKSEHSALNKGSQSIASTLIFHKDIATDKLHTIPLYTLQNSLNKQNKVGQTFSKVNQNALQIMQLDSIQTANKLQEPQPLKLNINQKQDSTKVNYYPSISANFQQFPTQKLQNTHLLKQIKQQQQKNQKNIIKIDLKWSLDQFEIGKCLGKGRFGNVYVVREKKSKQIFALKVISKQIVKESKMEKQILQEIKIQSIFNHPNITKLYGFFSDESNIYLIQELASHGDLFRHLKKQPDKRFSEQQAANYIRQVCECLQYMHSLKVIHRDIKPENILINYGVLKISDFGWATYTDDQRNTFCGTLDYVSPEVVCGSSYDYKVDLWSIGVLCYELLVGSPPFENRKNQQDSYEKIVMRDPNQRITIEEALHHPWLEKYNKNIFADWDQDVSQYMMNLIN